MGQALVGWLYWLGGPVNSSLPPFRSRTLIVLILLPKCFTNLLCRGLGLRAYKTLMHV